MALPSALITTQHIDQVLLADGKWYQVRRGSFKIKNAVFEDAKENPIPEAAGLHFSFMTLGDGDEESHLMFGPFTSILAYRMDAD